MFVKNFTTPSVSQPVTSLSLTIQNLVNHNSRTSDGDHFEGGNHKIETKSERHKSAKKILAKQEDHERDKNKTAKKDKKDKKDKGKGDVENKSTNVKSNKETRSKKSRAKDSKSRSKSRENGVDKKAYASRDSKKSYEFDFGSEDERIAAAQRARDKSASRKNKTKSVKGVEFTPKIEKKSRTNNATFTFEKQPDPKDEKDEMAEIKEQMKDFELQIISLIRNLKIDMEERAQLLDDKLILFKTPIENHQAVKTDIEYLKRLNEDLEEERKKDMLRTKKYVEEKVDGMYKDLEKVRTLDQKEVDKKLQQTKFEVVEQLIELTDNHKREIREIKYAIEKNREEVEQCQHSIKNLKRRTVEDSQLEEVRVLKKSESQLSTSINNRVDQKLDDKLDKLKREVKKNSEEFTQRLIEQNNVDFVIPTIENTVEKAEEYNSEKRSRVESHPVKAISNTDIEAK
jgi:hypothetical protein